MSFSVAASVAAIALYAYSRLAYFRRRAGGHLSLAICYSCLAVYQRKRVMLAWSVLASAVLAGGPGQGRSDESSLSLFLQSPTPPPLPGIPNGKVAKGPAKEWDSLAGYQVAFLGSYDRCRVWAHLCRVLVDRPTPFRGHASYCCLSLTSKTNCVPTRSPASRPCATAETPLVSPKRAE